MISSTALAEEALQQAKLLDAYISAQGRPLTSFDEDTLTEMRAEMREARDALVDSSHVLKRLALGPAGVLTEIKWAPTAYLSTAPQPSRQSPRKVACPRLVERFLRHAMGNHIFTEDAPGQVRHTASTRPLATDPYLSDAVAIMAKEIWSGATMVTDAIRQFNDSGEPTEAPYTLVNESSVAIWEYLAKQPSRAQRFRGAMKFFGDWSSKLLVSAYPWHQVDRLGAVVVEVGGGHEAVPKALAPATKNVRFVVQYLEDEVAHGGKTLPEDLKGKVEFMHHDIFTEQPVKVADVNFMRWILHDRIDKYAIRILRALAPAMKEVVLSEWLLKDGPETRMTEEYPRNLDLSMLVQFNSNERTAEAFADVLWQADLRFHIIDIEKSGGSLLAIFEVGWRSGG